VGLDRFGPWPDWLLANGPAVAGQGRGRPLVAILGALRSRLYVEVRSDPDQISEAAVSQAGLTILNITQIAANHNQPPHIKRVSAPPVWRPNSRGAAARFLKPLFPVFLPPRKLLSTIDTTPSCCRSHLPLHHISLDREGGVVGALYVCISRRRRHLRRWIGSDREEETASTTTSSTFC
jgi:hypothetical protein